MTRTAPSGTERAGGRAKRALTSLLEEMALFTDEFKAAALIKLQLNGGRVKETAGQIGVSKVTLQAWNSGLYLGERSRKAYWMIKKIVEQQHEERLEQLMELCKPEVIADQKVNGIGDLKTVFDIVEKETKLLMLLRNEPTAIVGHQTGPSELQKAREIYNFALERGASPEQALQIMGEEAPRLVRALIDAGEVQESVEGQILEEQAE